MNNILPISRIEKEICNKIESKLSKVGIFFRLFSRIKSRESINLKISKKEYSEHGPKLQDALGIRVVLYFQDDVSVVKNVLQRNFTLIDSAIDSEEIDRFCATRINFIFKIPNNLLDEFAHSIKHNKLIDATFELQVRTIFSEGWHEVEHDLRYKLGNAWEQNTDLSRILNGVLASLQSSEWTLEKIFSDLAYRHYKSNNIDFMLRCQFRLRFDYAYLQDNVLNYLQSNQDVLKTIFRIKRIDTLNILCSFDGFMPLNLTNFTYFLNYFYVKNSDLTSLTPQALLSDFNEVTISF